MSAMPQLIRFRGAVYRSTAAEDKTLLITDSDMDGSCCALAVLSLWPDADVEYESHGTVGERVSGLLDAPDGYGRVIVADMLPGDEELVRRLHGDFPGEVRIFDHHEEQDYLNELEGCRHDKGACSGLICTQELGITEEGQVRFAETVDAWDRMQEDSPLFGDARRLTMLHNFIGQPAFVKRGAKADLDQSEQVIMANLERAEKEQIDETLGNLRKFKDRDGQIFAMSIGLNSPLMFSSAWVARAVYKSDPRIDYVAVWHPGGTRGGSVSLYSRDGGFDVSEPARARGGGGHAGAAGFKPEEDLTRLVAKALFGPRRSKGS